MTLLSFIHFFLSRLLEKHSKQNLYGEETDEYNVGIYKDGELLAKGRTTKKKQIIRKL